MKNPVCNLIAAAVCSLLYLIVSAQPPVHQVLPARPLLFDRLPEKTALTASLFDQLFSSNISQKIRIPLTEGKFIEGIVKEKTLRNKHVASLIIECTNYDGALLTLSKVTADDATVTYRGRVVNIRYGDVLLLTQENNRYFLTKEKQSLVLVE